MKTYFTITQTQKDQLNNRAIDKQNYQNYAFYNAPLPASFSLSSSF